MCLKHLVMFKHQSECRCDRCYYTTAAHLPLMSSSPLLPSICFRFNFHSFTNLIYQFIFFCRYVTLFFSIFPFCLWLFISSLLPHFPLVCVSVRPQFTSKVFRSPSCPLGLYCYTHSHTHRQAEEETQVSRRERNDFISFISTCLNQ